MVTQRDTITVSERMNGTEAEREKTRIRYLSTNRSSKCEIEEEPEKCITTHIHTQTTRGHGAVKALHLSCIGLPLDLSSHRMEFVQGEKEAGDPDPCRNEYLSKMRANRSQILPINRVTEIVFNRRSNENDEL